MNGPPGVRARVGILVALLAWAHAAPARADSAADALVLLERGIALFQSGDLPAAREAFVKARDLVPDKANPYRWLGLVDARLGRCQDAVAELELFIARVPPGDPRTVEAVTLRDRCKDELRPKVGTLAIESTPPGAEVRLDRIDGAPDGVTPWRNAAVSVGSHLVSLSKPGYQPLTRSVTVARDESLQLDLVLAPVAARAPPLVAAPVPTVTAPPPAPEPRRRSRTALVLGLTLGAVAAVALGVGVGLGVGLSSGTTYARLPALQGQ